MTTQTKSLLCLVLGTSLYSSSALAARSTGVTIEENGKGYHGELFVPENPAGALPLVVVVHEWWGKNGYPEMRAKRIADELGYAAVAVDLYGDGKTVETPKEAQALAGPFYQDPMLSVERLKKFIAAAPAAAEKVKSALDLSTIAAIGYCFGGAQVLNLARADQMPQGEDLVAVVSFHGNLASSLKAAGPIKPKLLVLQGGADQFVKPDEVARFKAEMKKDQADLTFISYPGASHAFTNPKATEVGKEYKIPIAYDEKADADSWKQMKEFFRRIFKK